MKTLGKIIVHTLANAIAFLAANQFISGFSLSGDFIVLIITAFILTVAQVFVRPLLSLFFGPLILLSFGLFSIVINAGMLFILDRVSQELTIQGYIPLLLTTLLVSVAHIVIDMSGKWSYKND